MPQRAASDRSRGARAPSAAASISAASAAASSGATRCGAITAATSRVVSAYGKAREHLGDVLGRRPPLQRRVEVGDHDVVGLDRLVAAGLEPAPVAVARRSATARCSGRRRPCSPPCPGTRSGCRPRCAPRAVGLVGRLGRGVVDRGEHRRGVEPRHAPRARRRIPSSVSNRRRRREAGELQRAERRRARRGGRAAARRRSRGRRGRCRCCARAAACRTACRSRRNRQVAERAAARRVAARVVVRGALGQPDQREPPVELVAVAPARAPRGAGRPTRPTGSRGRRRG